MANKLTRMARELLAIEEDLPFRMNRYSKHNIDDFELYVFEQVWGSTSLGFGGMGGQAMTSANTYVFIPEVDEERCHVYFAGRFAYSADYTESFREDLAKHNMVSVSRSGKYKA